MDTEVRANNEATLTGLVHDDAGIRKEAAGNVNEYLRLRAREDGFARKIQPPLPATPADLDRQVDTVKPVIVKDMEPNSPAAYSVPFGTVPMNHYMDAPRYRIMFDRIMSHRFTADVANLMTYDMDIRAIFNDLMLKDILAEEDRKYMITLNTLCGAQDDVSDPHVQAVGAYGNAEVGSMDRTALANAMKALPSTNRHLNPASVLINNVTIWDVVAMDHDEIGGPLAEELLLRGFAEREMLGVKWMITIKTDLVPDDVIYQFAAPKFLGDFYTFEDVTVSTKHENFLFEMFAYEMIGATIKNEGAVARAEFTGTFTGWRATYASSSSSSTSASSSSSSSNSSNSSSSSSISSSLSTSSSLSSSLSSESNSNSSSSTSA